MSSKISLGGWTALIGGVVGLAAAVPAAQAQTVLTACTTISSPGNYVLGNSINAAGDCFTIAADNVAIDFNGKKLTGDGTGIGILDDGSPRSYAVISNGKIRNFKRGISLGASGYATIRRMDVSANDGIGIFINGCCSTLDAVHANGNNSDGILLGDCCSIVTNSETLGNQDDGMELQDCCHAVSNSTSSNNGDDGITGDGCCTSVGNSRISGNGDDGINLRDDDNIVTNSAVSGNGGDGVQLESSFNLVSNCTVKKNHDTGILMNDDDSNQVTATVSKNNDVGVSIECPSTLLDLKASGNPGGNLVESGSTCTKLHTP